MAISAVPVQLHSIGINRIEFVCLCVCVDYQVTLIVTFLYINHDRFFAHIAQSSVAFGSALCIYVIFRQ